ncbi:MAG: gamma-glutamyl-phosphate reductase, partial [Clostridia bacterium]|nr:gamma-glutamyl-phosphate reductase [Clostridia bacterium]
MIYEMLKKAKAASKKAVLLSNADKNKALNSMADALIRQTEGILLANEKDLLSATELSEVMKDRLRLTEERIASMADGLRKVATLPDPNGRVLETRRHQNGLQISKVSVPFGVIAVIFESRPNVAADTAGLALKSGNACVLRGGKESYNSCLA